MLPGLLAQPGNRNISPAGGSPHGGGHATAAAQRHNGAGGSGMGTRGRGGTAPQEEHMRHGHTRYGHLQAPARRSARWALCSTPTAPSAAFPARLLKCARAKRHLFQGGDEHSAGAVGRLAGGRSMHACSDVGEPVAGDDPGHGRGVARDNLGR